MTWKLILTCLGCAVAGFCGGWVSCAMSTINGPAHTDHTGHTGPEKVKGPHCPRCGHHYNDHEYDGCHVDGCGCTNNFIHVTEEA